MGSANPVMRAQLMRAYADNLITYLRTLHPECSEKYIAKFVETTITQQCTAAYHRLQQAQKEQVDLDQHRDVNDALWPTIQVVRHCAEDDTSHHHSYGNMTYYSDVDFLKYIEEFRNKVITPFGSTYETADHQESFLKGMIDGKGKARKREKKAMFLAKKNGDHTAEVFHNNAQANIKINMNSIIGAMGANFNFLSNIANFNAVTSTGRHFVMTAYAHAERFLESNYYFRTLDQVNNFLVTCQKYGPTDEDIVAVSSRYPLYQPTADDVYQWLKTALTRYNEPQEYPELERYVQQLTPARLLWIFYMSNMRRLVFQNEQFFRPWMDKFFNVEAVDVSAEVDPEQLNEIDGDLSVVLATIAHQIIPTNKSGNSINLGDTITQAPDVAKRLVHYGHHLQKCIDEIQPLFDLFMDHRVGIGYLAEHKQMFRDAVILSDTDSIIFTTREWVQWYLKSTQMTPLAFSTNALVVYWLSKATANIVYHLSVNIGAVGADAKRMNMKNEFMMPVEILTTLKKHYASILKIQEGVFYGTPRLDIKGVNLRGSNFSKDTLNYTTWFIQALIDEVYNKGEISLSEFIVYVLRFERMILDSLRNGQTRFLTVDPIKNEDEYKSVDQSIYFNYLFWEEVFGDKYGNIAIPTKCFILPLVGVKSGMYQFYLETEHPDIAKRLAKFISKYPKKELSRIPINPLTNQIPEELKKVADYKYVIYANTKPLYLILSSFGMNTGATKKQHVLFSDLYGWVKLSEQDQQQLTKICETGSL